MIDNNGIEEKTKISTENLITKQTKLTKDIDNLKGNYSTRKNWNFIWIISVVISIVVIYLSNEYSKGIILTLSAVVVLLIAVLGLITNAGSNTTDKRAEAEKSLELSIVEDALFTNEIFNMTQEERAVRQLSKSKADLEKYYQLNYNHLDKVFNIGKWLLSLGNMTILLTVLAIILKTKDLDSIIFILGFVGGILIDFTGAIFIIIYSKTIKSANMNQYGMLETNQAYLGNVLVSQINNEDLREKTLSEMANKLIEKKKDINFTE
ncbi:hypothetical protein [Carnobacterium maltaromaticum]|uniref:hypothetical protein n=1 Tax=Carnobacterium maltaromaticum TaxID=2751 RepID=UPI0039AF36EA